MRVIAPIAAKTSATCIAQRIGNQNENRATAGRFFAMG